MSNARVHYDFQGAHILVTGGSNGIGYAIASSFAAACGFLALALACTFATDAL